MRNNNFESTLVDGSFSSTFMGLPFAAPAAAPVKAPPSRNSWLGRVMKTFGRGTPHGSFHATPPLPVHVAETIPAQVEASPMKLLEERSFAAMHFPPTMPAPLI